jgi:selenide,water dikinase
MEIDLVRLCASVGARLIIDQVTGLNLTDHELQFDSRPPIPFNVLSIGIGSVPGTDGLVAGSEQFVAIKPMQTFRQRLAAVIGASTTTAGGDSRLRVLIVGGGVAGTEITFCLPHFLRQISPREPILRLVTRSNQIVPSLSKSTRRRLVRELNSRGVDVTTGRQVTQISRGQVSLDDGSTVHADVVIWATGADAPPLLGKLGLPVDLRGFLATDATLQSVSGEPVFAVGDTGTIVSESVPKAGVYAVRQGPVLWDNIHRLLDRKSLRPYVPQRSFLKLINLADGRALGQWHGLALTGHWVMKWKNSIDTNFMKRYQPEEMTAADDQPMQCRGCGSKLGSQMLTSALRGDDGEAIAFADAAEIGSDPEHPLVASTDFFSNPVDDAFLAGRLAALHTASDIIATGSQPTHALANVVLPDGDPRSQQRLLKDFLMGARQEFDAMNSSIVGGHTIVGPRFESGFTVVGRPLAEQRIEKSNLAPGQLLYLTKPLGIGILLAAQMRGLCDAEDYQSLIDAMTLRQHAIAAIAVDCQIRAGTDVTGFGLAGHLLEMLEASRVSAILRLDDIPLLAGVRELVRQGVESSLAPENRRIEGRFGRDAASDSTCRRHPAYSVMFDPQTCGGFLFGVPPDQCQRFETSLARADLPKPTVIGEVTSENDDYRVNFV